MYSILFSTSAVVQLILIILIINKNLTGSIVFRVLTGLMIYLSGNTLSGMFGYYVSGMQVNRWFLLGAQLLLIVVYSAILLKSEGAASKVHVAYENHVQEFIWLITFGALFIALLCSTQFSLMPVWGNVDEAVHIEVSAQFRNILDGGTNSFYRMLADIHQGLNRYSYMWAYHYNCAVISKVLHMDVLHINHIIKCLSLSLFITVPILWLRPMNKKNILVSLSYMVFMVLFADNWYVFFEAGYTAQIFSLAIAHTIIAYYIKIYEEKNMVLRYIFLPTLTLFCIESYPLTGAVLLVFIVICLLYAKDIKGLIIQLLCCLFIIPLPPIWNQLMYFLFGRGSADEALTAASALTDKPSVFWILFGIIEIGILLYKYKTPNAKWMLYVACWFAAFFGMYFIGDSIGYVMYKIMVSMFPLLIFWMCYIGIETAFYLKCSENLKMGMGIVSVLCCMGILCLLNIASFSTQSIKSILVAQPQITRDEYACLKVISNYDTSSYDGVEYIGMNGPTIRVGFVFLRQIPFSWVNSGTGWSFKSNFYTEDILDGLKERVFATEDIPRNIYVVINEEKAENLEAWEEYSSVLSENTEIYRSGNCSVRRLSFRENLRIESLSYQDLLENRDFVMANIPNYDECALVNELDVQKTYNFSFDHEMELGLIDIKGRSIHGSEFILRLLNEGKTVLECNLSGFEKRKMLQLDEKIICDSCEISVTGKAFSDSIILKEVNFYEVGY